jgi:hypothetical protein
LSLDNSTLRKDTDNSTGLNARDRRAQSPDANSTPIDGKSVQSVNRFGDQMVTEKLNARHEVNLSIHQGSNHEGVQVSKVTTCQDETTGNLRAFRMKHDGFYAIEMDETGNGSAHGIKPRHSSRSIAVKAGAHQR